MIIKPIHEITIRDYNIIEQTGKFNHLVRWFPAVFFTKQIREQLKKIGKIINDSEGEDDNSNLIWQLQTIAKIQAIEINYLGIINLFNLGLQVSTLSELMPKKKVNINSKNAKKFIENIYNYTGIDIKNLSDVEKVRKELEYRKDKYNEIYGKVEQKKETVYLMSVVLGVFSYLNQPINVDMTLMDFDVLKKEAVKKMQKEKTKWQK